MSMESVDRPASQTLREAREHEGWELEYVSQQTKIPVNFLQAIEAGKWEVLPGTVYSRAFVNTLARLYGLDQKQLAAQLRAELHMAPPEPTAIPAEVIHDFAPEPDSTPVVPSKKSFGLWIAIAVIALLFGGTLLFTQLPERPAAPAQTADTAQDSAVDSQVTTAEQTAPPPSPVSAVLRVQDSSEAATILFLRDNMVHKTTLTATDSMPLPKDTAIMFRNISGKFLKLAGTSPMDSIGWKFFQITSQGDSFHVQELDAATWYSHYNATMAQWGGHHKSRRQSSASGGAPETGSHQSGTSGKPLSGSRPATPKSAE